MASSSSSPMPTSLGQEPQGGSSSSSFALLQKPSELAGRSGSTSSSLGWQDPPSNLVLTQVHYLIRHGERTPVRSRLQNANPPIPTRWNVCHAGRQFKAAVIDLAAPSSSSSSSSFFPSSSSSTFPPSSSSSSLGTDNVCPSTGQWVEAKGEAGKRILARTAGMQVQRAVESTDERDRILPVDNGECLLGELTDLGRTSTFVIGARLRDLYVNRLGFLPKQLTQEQADHVYFRSTNMPRTVESLQSIIRGLLPEAGAVASPSGTAAFIPTVLTRNGTSENLLPNTFACARLRQLDSEFSKMAAALHNPKLTQYDDVIAPHCDGKPPRVDGHPRLNGVLDTVRASMAHGIAVPEAFKDVKMMADVERAVVDEWFMGYEAEDAKTRSQFRRLAMGRFLNDLTGRLASKATKEEAEPLKMAVYSAHDTSLAGLLSTLDVFDHHWPAFTASIGLELFKDASKGKSGWFGRGQRPHYIRMRYGDDTLQLPACVAEGNHYPGHKELCTLEAFAKTVESLKHPQGHSWEQECDEGRPARSSK